MENPSFSLSSQALNILTNLDLSLNDLYSCLSVSLLLLNAHTTW